MTLHINRLAAAALWLVALVPAARAGMIPISATVTADSGKFRWTYGVEVTTDVKVNPGDSFTVYDFAGLVNGSIVAPTGWTISSATAGPLRPDTNPHDNPTIPNLTFTYTGTVPINGQQGLGNFSALSAFGTSTVGDFTSGVHRQIDGRAEDNITTTDVPLTPSGGGTHSGGGDTGGGGISQTPEPPTLALLGAALPLLGIWRAVRLGRKAG